MARRPEALLAMNIASLIFRPDLGFLALTSFQSFKRPSLSFGSSSRISLRRQPFSVSQPRLRPPGNIHNRSRLLLTNKIRPRFATTSFDDFAITVPHRVTTNSFVRSHIMFLCEKIRVCCSAPLAYSIPRPQLHRVAVTSIRGNPPWINLDTLCHCHKILIPFRWRYR